MVGIVLLFILTALIILINAVVPISSAISLFELKRRSKEHDEDAELQLTRERLSGDIVSLQRITTSILLVLIVICCISTFGWIVGTVIAIFIALEYSAVARLPLARSIAQKYYQKYETPILTLINNYEKVFWWLRAVAPEVTEGGLASKAELEHLVETAGATLKDNEKKMIQHSLNFDKRQVKDIMTPRSVVDTIKKTEILGPLVLDSLHKTGHSRFPVTDGDIDHVVGTLFLRDVLTIDTKRKHTATAETAMEKRVFYINEEQSLIHALTAFLKTHHHLFIVVNEFRETVGILSLEDTMEAMLGRPIVDEFDAHDDLRKVAARKAEHKDMSNSSTDV
jgi:CBS domain containing-hemolysin-like protein